MQVIVGGAAANPTCTDVRIGISCIVIYTAVRRHSHAGARHSRHTGCMVILTHRCNISVAGGLLTRPLTPQRGNTSGTLQLQCLALVAAYAFQPRMASAGCTPARGGVGEPSPSFGRPAARGCSACSPVLFLPRRNRLLLLLFCTRPPLFVRVLWPVPAWVCVMFNLERIFFRARLKLESAKAPQRVGLKRLF